MLDFGLAEISASASRTSRRRPNGGSGGGRRRAPDRDGRPPRHPPLRGAGGDPPRAGRPRLGHLLLRRDRLRDAGRQAAVRRIDAGGAGRAPRSGSPRRRGALSAGGLERPAGVLWRKIRPGGRPRPARPSAVSGAAAGQERARALAADRGAAPGPPLPPSSRRPCRPPACSSPPGFPAVERWAYDLRIRAAPARAPDPRILLVTLDEASLAGRSLPLADRADEIGGTLERIFAAGARGVAVDLLLPEPWSASPALLGPRPPPLRRPHPRRLLDAGRQRPRHRQRGRPDRGGPGPPEGRVAVRIRQSGRGPGRRDPPRTSGLPRPRRRRAPLLGGAGRGERSPRSPRLPMARFSGSITGSIRRASPGSPGGTFPARWRKTPGSSATGSSWWEATSSRRGTTSHRVPRRAGRAETVSGLVLQALLVDTLAAGLPVREAPRAPFLAGAALWAGLAAAALLLVRRPAPILAVLLAGLLLYLGLSIPDLPADGPAVAGDARSSCRPDRARARAGPPARPSLRSRGDRNHDPNRSSPLLRASSSSPSPLAAAGPREPVAILYQVSGEALRIAPGRSPEPLHLFDRLPAGGHGGAQAQRPPRPGVRDRQALRDLRPGPRDARQRRPRGEIRRRAGAPSGAPSPPPVADRGRRSSWTGHGGHSHPWRGDHGALSQPRRQVSGFLGRPPIHGDRRRTAIFDRSGKQARRDRVQR